MDWFLLATLLAVDLSSGQLRLAVNDQGRLAELTNPATGARYVSGPPRTPWRMFYRTGDALDVEIEPEAQSAQVRREGDALAISYATLRANLPVRGQTREIRAGFTLRFTLNGDRLEATGTIENREPGIEITEVWLPWIQGLADMELYWPERAGRRIPNPAARIARETPPWLRLTYPWPASMAWFTFNNGQEGLYIGSHDRTLMTSCLNVMAQPLSASVVKYPFVKTGQTWTSEPVVLRLYRGDWHEAARTYRAWAETWMPKPSPPQWVRRAPGWAHPALGRKSQFGHVTGRYADYPAMLAEARQAGLNTLIVFGWVKQGFDNRYPHYDPDEALGGAEALKQAIAEVERAGGKLILYTQGQLIDPTTEFYRTKGRDIVAKDVWGYEYREQYAQHSAGTFLNQMRNKFFGVACPSARGWRQQLESQFNLVSGFGAQGILYDQLGGIPPYICFSKEHPHAKPSLAVGPEKVANLRALREQIKKQDPEFALVIELGTDCYAGLVDIIHSHGIGFWPAPEAFGEMFCYTFPDVVITNRAGGPSDRRTQWGHAFSLGLRFDASTNDAKDAYFTRLCQLRNRHPELLLEGRFSDTEGFGTDNPQVSAHSFVGGDRMAVVLWNPGEKPQRVGARAPGRRLETAEWPGAEGVLPPGEVAVLLFGAMDRRLQ